MSLWTRHTQPARQKLRRLQTLLVTQTIAHIETLYSEKFGVPRQAGLVDTPARVVFEPGYRVAEAVRGLEVFDYVWLVWLFHLADDTFRPTVRPPRLGGNRRVGVFATRSPFRPNAIGLSSVRLLGVDMDKELGPVLRVVGADMVDGTPILDIKPYLPYADSHPDARAGFAQEQPVPSLSVLDPEGMLENLKPELRKAVVDTVRQDPRPHYQHDAQRVYTLTLGGCTVAFRVDGTDALIVKIS